MNRKLSNKKREKGQGLVEYALILVLVAIVVIGALMVLGPIIGNSFSTINNSLSSVGSSTSGGSGGGCVPSQGCVPPGYHAVQSPPCSSGEIEVTGYCYSQ
jgi:pilus assembly protein Flp/PilA